MFGVLEALRMRAMTAVDTGAKVRSRSDQSLYPIPNTECVNITVRQLTLPTQSQY